MKVYLDDLREAPEGWIQTRWPSDTIALLETGMVSELSLDFDLGDAETADREGRPERTGYQVLLWIEEKLFFDSAYPIPKITLHSDNGPGLNRMRAALEQIEDIVMKIKFTYEVEIANYLLEFEVSVYATPGYPGKTWGPPENCYPGEPTLVEDYRFKLVYAGDENGKLPASVVAIDADEFVWLFGMKEMERVEDAALNELAEMDEEFQEA